MGNRDRILEYLHRNRGAWCDDCLSEKIPIASRQQVNALCSSLASAGDITRERNSCHGCRKWKLVNSPCGHRPTSTARLSATGVEERQRLGQQPWYSEVNVQACVVSHLAKNGYRIVSVANTAARTTGKDIEAITPSGASLWVSVKGYPEHSKHTQARHWFSSAVFDMILYRQESGAVELAAAFPDGFSTYLNLSPRITWFKQACRFAIYWVASDGSVRIE